MIIVNPSGKWKKLPRPSEDRIIVHYTLSYVRPCHPAYMASSGL